MKGKLIIFITLISSVFAESSRGISISGEFLWWRGKQEELRYATTGVGSSGRGSVHSVSTPWEPGFRVGLGYSLPRKNWDIAAKYTWYHSSSTSRAKDSSGNIAPIPLTLEGFSGPISEITSAKSDWHLHYNTLDLELGCTLSASKFITFRLFSGLRGSLIDQEWDTRYVANEVTIGSATPSTGWATTKQDQDSWGIGIRFGGNSTWTLGRGVSIIANMAFSGVHTDFDTLRKDRFKNDALAVVATNISSDPSSIIACFEMLLGLKGEWELPKGQTYLSASAGWETVSWINYGHFISLTRQSNGDLTFNGLSAKLALKF